MEDPSEKAVEEAGQLLKRLETKHRGRWKNAVSYVGRGFRSGTKKVSGWVKNHKRAAMITGLAAALGCATTCYLAHEYMTRRLIYPRRHVLFNVTYNERYAGGPEEVSSEGIDFETITRVYRGGEASQIEGEHVQETRSGSFEFETVRQWATNTYSFTLRSHTGQVIASSSQTPELIQPWVRARGLLNYREEDASFPEETRSDHMIVDKFILRRALWDKELTSMLISGERVLAARLIDARSWPLGLFLGREYRAGTFIEHYQPSPERLEIIGMMRQLTNQQLPQGERERLFYGIYDNEANIPAIPILSSFEDGIIDMLPQESTLYLGSHPGRLERILNAYRLGLSDQVRLRVENHWDFFPWGLTPGNYGWPINRINIGQDRDTWNPFNHYNNGGYEIVDEFGTVARVDIEDFWIHFGLDSVYHYYADLNGDGRISSQRQGNPESVGRVLISLSNDRPLNIEWELGIGERPKDVTQTMNYTFMGPTGDHERDMESFLLCNYIETMMPDQIHRGYGLHSYLGGINDVRAEIRLFYERNWDNMSRALTEESVLPAPHDIVRLLIATGRPYAEHVAERYGIADQYQGQFQPSQNLHERWNLGMWPGTLLVFGAAGGLYALWRRKRREHPIREETEQLLERIDGN